MGPDFDPAHSNLSTGAFPKSLKPYGRGVRLSLLEEQGSVAMQQSRCVFGEALVEALVWSLVVPPRSTCYAFPERILAQSETPSETPWAMILIWLIQMWPLALSQKLSNRVGGVSVSAC